MKEIRIRAGTVELAGEIHLPAGTGPAPAVLLFHGLGSDRRELAELPAFLAGRGLIAAAFDLSGHGRSSGQRGLVTCVGLTRDALAAAAAVRARPRCDGRLAAVGHSVGAAAALAACSGPEAPARCAVLLAPPCRTGDAVTGLERLGYGLAYRLDRLTAGFGLSLRLPYRVGYGRVLEDPEARRAARRLGFLQRSLPAASYPCLIRELDLAAQAARVSVPVLVVVAGRDRVIPPAHSGAVRAALAGPSELARFEHSGHSLLLDVEGAAVRERVADWLAQHLPLEGVA